MQYQIPQFINIEDKIVGPFTARQTVYLMIGISFSALVWTFFYEIVAILIALPIIILTLALCFYKPSGRPLATMIVAAINYFKNPKTYVWYRSPENFLIKREIKRQDSKTATIPVVSRNRLKELAWMLDTHYISNNKF